MTTPSTSAQGPVRPKPLDLSNMLRDAFLAGRGLKDGDKLSEADQAAWVAYDPERMTAYKRICAYLAASPSPAASPSGVEAGEPIYRFLRIGDVIEAGDECPSDNCERWEPVNR